MRKVVSPTGFALAVVLAGLASAGPAMAAYECINDEITGTSAPERRTANAEREAKRSWEHAARSKYGFNYRWVMAYKAGHQPTTTSRGANAYVGTARAYPCRIKPAEDVGTVQVFETEAEAACGSRPGFETARRHGCRLFYLLGD